MASCVRAIQKVLRTAGYTSIITFTDGGEKVEAEEIDYPPRHQVDGLTIVPAVGAASHFRSVQLLRTPLVSFDQPILGDSFDTVLVKNQQFARIAVEHLIGHGHGRIARIGMNRHLYSIRQRIEGYRAAMKEANLPQIVEIVNVVEDEGVSKQLRQWLQMKSPPTAVFSLNELTTIRTIEALADPKIRNRINWHSWDSMTSGSARILTRRSRWSSSLEHKSENGPRHDVCSGLKLGRQCPENV